MSTEPAPIKFKQGQTFVAACVYTGDDNTPFPLTGITVTSQVRDKDNHVVADLQVTIDNELLGQFTVESTSSTLDWPLQTLYWDILTDDSGVLAPTQTMQLRMLKSVTRI